MTRILVPLLILCLALSSCTTLLNSPKKTLKIINDVDSAQILINDADTLTKGLNTISVYRSRKDIKVSLHNTKKNDSVYIKNELDPLFIVGNLYFTSGFGCFVDLTNNKRFTYERLNHIYLDNGKLILDQPAMPINLFGSFYGLNQHSLKSRTYNSTSITPGGLNMGAELYINPKTYISGALQFSFLSKDITNSDIVEYKAFAANILLNYKIDRFHMGIGLCYLNLQENTHNYAVYDYSVNNNTWNDFDAYGPGVALEIQYCLYDNFFMTAMYNSIIYNSESNVLNNSSLFSVGIKYKFEMGNFDDKRLLRMMNK